LSAAEATGNQILAIEARDGRGALTAAEFITSGIDTFEVVELDSNLEQIGNALMFQTEDYSGTVLLNTWAFSGSTAYLDIKTSGSWTISLEPMSAVPVMGLDPGLWTRCHFGYAASVRVADRVAS
jgi:hypothetical protein